MTAIGGAEAWKRWERTVVAQAQAYGLPWERRLRLGDNHDLLDLDGCLPGGWLVGCKSVMRKGGASRQMKMSEAMDQCDRALINIGRPSQRDGNGRLVIECGGIVPVQVLQRSGYPPGKSYVVTELDYFLRLAVDRQKWEQE